MESKNSKGIYAVFQYLDDMCRVIDEVENKEGFKNHVVYSHTSYHELMDRAEAKWGKSEVRWFTLVGALLGVSVGFGMCLAMDYDWPITVGGKTAGFDSIIAYVIFGFELMILLGAIATIIGMLVMGRLPNPKVKIYDKRTTDDRFSIFVPSVHIHGPEADFLRKQGAEEIFEI